MNKVVFVTGATRGIGKQIALSFAKKGYDIAINYRTENEELQKEMIQNQIKYMNKNVCDDISNKIIEECKQIGRRS